MTFLKKMSPIDFLALSLDFKESVYANSPAAEKLKESLLGIYSWDVDLFFC